jgi:uracil-DNA glycosylase family 4
MDPVDSLARLTDDVVDCRRCPRLVAWRELVATEKRAAFRDWDYWGRPVPGFGDPAARVVIVGLAPAAHGANRTGRMFTGDRSGDFLYASLYRCGFANRPTSIHRNDGLRLLDVYITAPVRCPPPANKPTPGERDECRPFMERELALLPNLRVVICLGQFGWNVLSSMLDLRPRPRFAHGAEVALPGDRTLLGCYHVSQQNTFTGKLTPAMLDGVFRRAAALCGSG